MTAMTNLSLSERSDHGAYVSIMRFATLFAIVSYAATSMRAILSPYEVNDFIDAKRIFSVALGAFILWLAIRAVERRACESPGAQIFAVLNVAIPGAIGLLLARETYDLVAFGEVAQKLALNIRWMLTWIGYFGAAVAGFLALGYYRQLQAVMAQGPVAGSAVSTRADDAPTRSAPGAQAAYEVADIDFDPRTSSTA